MTMKNKQIINRIFTAVCGFQIVKGGGGGYNSLKGACIRGFSALSAAVFSATIQKIIIAAVFFAAGLSNISANAQESGDGVMNPATARVYSPPGMLPLNPNNFGTPTMVDFNQAVVDAVPDIPINQFIDVLHLYFLNVIGENTNAGVRIDTATGLPDFGLNGGVLDFGQIVVLTDVNLIPIANTQITTRIYRGDDGRHYMAAGEGTELPAPAVAPANVAMLNDDEFFILGDTGDANAWTATRTISQNAIGFTPAECNSGYQLQPDMTSCELIPANCGENATNAEDVTMCVCENTETHQFVDGSTTTCELISEGGNTDTGTNPPSQITPQNRADNKKRRAESINTATGLLAVGVIAVFLAGGVPSFNMSPDFGYRITESGYYANIGGRADFRKDNWHLYYTANQTNSGGEFADFRYTSGGRYNGDLFAAAFSESVAGETANYNFSLSADVDGRLVDFSPVYRLHSEYDKGKFSTRNELNLQSNFHYNGWTINSSAGFRWENANDFSENARFQINAIHRF